MLRDHHPEVIRYFLLSSHYRSSLNYSEDNLLNASKSLARLYQSLKDVAIDETLDEEWVKAFTEAMNDDFNTPIALSVLFQLSRELNKSRDPILAATLKHLAGIMGLLQEAPEEFLQAGFGEEDKSEIELLITERRQAKAEKNWAKADEIRAALLQKGIELEDNSTGTTWRHRD